MSPEDAISSLDRTLAQHGQPVTLRRLLGTQQTPIEASVNAFVRNYDPKELVNGLVQGDCMVTLSPTDLEAAHWPGATVTQSGADKMVPTVQDKIVIAGVERRIKAPKPIYLNGRLVRIDLTATG